MDAQVAQLLTGLITGTFTLAAGLGVTVMNQRASSRQREEQRTADAAAKVSKVVRDQLDAATNLQQVVHQTAPQWNAWSPKLMMLGSVLLEGLAVKRSGAEVAWAQAGRVAITHGEKELSVVPPIAAAVDRVRVAAIDAVLLPPGDVQDAVIALADAALAVNQAYSIDLLWHPRQARATRAAADAALQDAIRHLMVATDPPTPSVSPAARKRSMLRPRHRTKLLPATVDA